MIVKENSYEGRMATVVNTDTGETLYRYTKVDTDLAKVTLEKQPRETDDEGKLLTETLRFEEINLVWNKRGQVLWVNCTGALQ